MIISVVFTGIIQEVKMQLKIGDPAPLFTMKSHLDSMVSLADFRGKNVVIAFFPLAFTPI
jgi:peroxiredoxin